MKNIIVLLILISISFFLQAQVKSEQIRINWNNSEISASNNQLGWYFEGSKDMGVTGLVPYYVYLVSFDENETVVDIKLTNIIEESVALKDDLFSAIQFEVTYEYQVQVNYLESKSGRSAQIIIPTIRITNLPGVISRLNQFTLNYRLDQQENRNKPKSAQNFVKSSVMSSGEWYQFQIATSGIYKMTYEQLTEAGIDPSQFASSQLKMYGFGGMLPEKNSNFRYPDIPEVAIEMVDGGDNVFNAGDYFLFYAQGPDTWKYNSNDKRFNHQINIYDRYSYYYFVLSPGDGKRITQSINSQSPLLTVNSFIDYDFVEDETHNLINSGRRWFGDEFEFTTDYQYNFSFENIKPNTEIKIKTVLAARSTTSSRFTVSSLGESDIVSIVAISTGTYASYAVGGESDLTLNSGLNTQNIAVDISYNQPITSSVGWLDYIEVEVERNLLFNSGQMAFRNPNTIKDDGVSEFVIQNNSANNPQVWDVTNQDQVYRVNYQNESSQISFVSETEELREFVIFDNATFLTATYVKEVANQNLHAELNHDYIIITYPDFMEQANELADFHRNNSGLDVFVTTLEPIYHEFSSGRQDVSAIRDFVRSVYLNSEESARLKYLLLFGDASMDYLLREENNTNMVPTWQTYESFNPITSIATDDFFGFMDESEGDFNTDVIDIGIGRFPVVSATEAQNMVNKIKHYKSNSSSVMADWRNTICFIADDEDSNRHIADANKLSVLVDTIYPFANLDKIYVDAYAQESTPAGQRYPLVNEAINERVDKGSIIISYTGHGGEVGWGQERFLDIPDIQSWTNYDKLPVFLTATCEFARYDDPDRVSAGELIFLSNKGGGISLFTTSRATFATSNMTVSTNFYKNALDRENGSYLTMGEILKRTKIASGTGWNVNKFVLLGDPALTICMPEKNIEITSILNNGSGLEVDTISALSNITIKGEIRDENNQIMRGFNGVVYPTIYDKPSTVSTLGNDSGSSVFEFDLQKNILYKGTANVVNGEFEFTFIVPKDIAYKYGNGKISLYAENGEIDATGYDNDIIIGGFDAYSSEDDEGPEITLYINNTNFINGGITDENPVLLAFVQDENGINTTGNGIGHDISATLDSDPNNVKILNDYYVSDANSYKSGVISFPFFNIEDGGHTLELKVWDIHNNSNKASIDFVVASSGAMALEQLFNYPNPVIDYTTFSFEHNQSGEDMDVIIDIYGIDGKLVTRLRESFLADSYRNNDIKWDATDNNGSKIAKGVYIYKVSVQLSNGIEASQSNRLVVIK